MAGSRDHCDAEALESVLNGSWDGNAVQFLQKYEIQRTVMSNPLLQRLKISDEPVILVQRYQRSKMSPSKSICSSLSTVDASDRECELELTGCPLEWTPEPSSFSHFESSYFEDSSKNSESSCKTKLRPLPAAEARSLLNAVANRLSSCGSETEMQPMWVACDGTDPQGTAYLGYHRGDGTCSRVAVSCRGPMESKDDLPAFGCIQRNQFWGLSQSRAHTTMEVNAKYDILRHCDPLQRSSSEDIMVVECSWNKVTTLQEPPSADALCHLSIQIVPGNERSATWSLYKELQFLKRLVECLTTGTMTWSPEPTEQPYLERVKSMLQGHCMGSFRGKKSGHQFSDIGCDSSDFNLFIETVVMGKRQSVDFTDDVWTTLSGCSTFQELKDGLALIFRAVQAGETRPRLLADNGTMLAGVLRTCCGSQQQKRPESALEGLVPIRMMAEIGIQKLQRDYLSLYLGLELASQEQLMPLLLDPCMDLGEALGELMKLQAVLDIVVLCKTYLHLPTDYLSGYAREALKYFTSCERGKYIHKFRFPLAVSKVREALDDIPPMEWTVSIESHQGSNAAHTIAHISTTCPFDHLLTEKNVGKDNGRPVRDGHYYCTTVSLNQDELRL
ncbi:protein zwilch homolog isoform X2 [Haemaphysalis longicornis]